MGDFIISLILKMGSLGKALYDLCMSNISFLGFNINLLAFCGGAGLLGLLIYSFVRG